MKIVYSTMQSMHKVKGGLREGHLDFQRSRPGCLGLGMPAKLPLIEKPLHPQPVHPVGPPLIQSGKMCSKFIQKYCREMRELGWIEVLCFPFLISIFYFILSGCLSKVKFGTPRLWVG